MPNLHMWKRPGSAKWQLRKPVPADVQHVYGREVVTMSLGTEDDLIAAQRAIEVLGRLKTEWEALRQGLPIPHLLSSAEIDGVAEPAERVKQSVVRSVYEQVVRLAEQRDNAAFVSDRAAHLSTQANRRASLADMAREVRAGQVHRVVGPVEKILANRGIEFDRDAPWFAELLEDAAKAVLDGIDVNLRADEGEIDPRPKSEVVKKALSYGDPSSRPADVAFSMLADRFMKWWLAERKDAKDTNTEQQKRATFRLFGSFFDDRPIRFVRGDHAAEFSDTLRLFDPSWARSPAARKMSWQQLSERYADRSHGLADATMNRHLQVLQELWDWAKKRGHCAGENPFNGFHKKLRAGVNVKPYLAWESDELRKLLDPPPKRADLLELILVGMFTGMRLDEIASLTWRRIQTSDEGIVYFQVEDAKTPAGNRMIPVHHDLKWLLSRGRGAPDQRLWPAFNDEGRGKKPGADAGREFSRFKAQRGFTDRAKAFHSFRKNVTRMMERAGVAENDWAQIFGHERGFTYKVYNPDGITMERRAAIIALIAYPLINIPHPD